MPFYPEELPNAQTWRDVANVKRLPPSPAGVLASHVCSYMCVFCRIGAGSRNGEIGGPRVRSKSTPLEPVFYLFHQPHALARSTRINNRCWTAQAVGDADSKCYFSHEPGRPELPKSHYCDWSQVPL